MKIDLKNGTLKVSKALICEDEKKVRLHLLLTVGKISQLNFIYPYIRLSDSTTLIFWKAKLEMCCKLINIPPLSLETPLQTFFFRIEKIFYVSIQSLKTKRVRMKTCLQCLNSSLRYSATHFHLKQNFFCEPLHLCFLKSKLFQYNLKIWIKGNESYNITQIILWKKFQAKSSL